MDEPTSTAAPSQPPLPGSPGPPRPRRLPVGLVLAVSILSASLSSGATALALGRGASPALTTATMTAAASAMTASTGSTAGVATTADAAVAAAAVVSPAVVTITTTSVAGPGPFGASTDGVGSGVIYDSNGWILTAAHVVEGATSVTVSLADGRELAGTVTATDTALDLAVLRIEGDDLPAAAIGTSSDLLVGQMVIAIGSALGEYEGSVTSGVLSATDRSITVSDGTRSGRELTGLLQTDAAINEGDSGGPLVDAGGRVIGIITAGSTTAQGLGFAVPIDAATTIISQAAAA